MKETVLLFNIQDEARLRGLKRILMLMKVRVRVVKKDEYLQPVGFLAGVKELEAEQPVYEGEELDNEMMVMAGFSSSQVDLLLAQMRKAKLTRMNYKAILTPTNMNWTVPQLYEELKKEHDYVTQMHSQK